MISRVCDWWSQPIGNWSPSFRRHLLWTIVVSNFLIFVALAYGYGPSMTNDGVRDYTIGVFLTKSGFSLELEDEQIKVIRDYGMAPPILYFLYHSLLGVIHLVAGEYWLHVLVLINALVQTFVNAALLIFVTRYFQSRAALIGMSVMSVGCWEYLQWIPYSQSDTLFGALIFAVLLLTYRQWMSLKFWEGAGWALAASFLTLVAAFFRPTAVPLLTFTFFTMVFGAFLADKSLEEKARVLGRWTPLLIGALLITIPLLVFPSFDPSVMPEGGISDAFAHFHEKTAAGMILLSRPDYTISVPGDYAGFLLIAGLRLLCFFLFVSNDFSTSHNIVNILFFLPFYAFVGFGIWRVIWQPIEIALQIRIICLLAISMTVLFDTFHAVTLIDFDWRYRVPVYPALFLLATVGIDRLTMERMTRVPKHNTGPT